MLIHQSLHKNGLIIFVFFSQTNYYQSQQGYLFIRYFLNITMLTIQPILNYLQSQSITIEDNADLPTSIISIMMQKQQIIQNLSQQITTYKCEQIKNKKLIKQLQDKIIKIAPSSCDTGSNFMMASQFKNDFEEVMTTAVSTALGPIVDRPKLFSKCTSDVIRISYDSVENRLDQIIGQIYNKLDLQTETQARIQIQAKIKLGLMKVLQQYSALIFPFKQKKCLYQCELDNGKQNMLIEELNEIVHSQEYQQLSRQLHKLSVYMVLQDKRWQIVDMNTYEVIKYSKKQFTCIDGWIKEGDDALLVLRGIRRDGHMHPSLKNYVVACQQDDIQSAVLDLLILKQPNSKPQTMAGIIKLQESKQNSKSLYKSTDLQVQKSIKLQPLSLLEQECWIFKNKSVSNILEHKENQPNNKKLKKEKAKQSLENSTNADKSPKNKQKKDKHDQSVRRKKNSDQIKQFQEKVVQLKQDYYIKKKNIAISKNISSDLLFQDTVTFPLRVKNPLQELPVNRQIPQRKKIKPQTSRKNSVGKIVNQNHMINNFDKQNIPNLNLTKPLKLKQKTYKQIIKQKLLEDKYQDKTHHSIIATATKMKGDRQKKKQQNRPLKLQSNANKLRQKYIN